MRGLEPKSKNIRGEISVSVIFFFRYFTFCPLKSERIPRLWGVSFSGEGEFDLIFKINFDKRKVKKKKKNLRSVSTVFCIWRSWTQIYCFRFPFICFSCFFSSFRWLLSFLQKALLDFIFRMRLDNVGSIGGNRCEAFNSDRVSKISKLFFSKCCINLSWQFITNHYFSFSSTCLSLLIFFIFLQKPSAWGRM